MSGRVQRWRNEHIRELLRERAVPMPSGCLVWTGAANGLYGTICYNGKRVPVHRLVWELEHGPIPPGLVIDHVRARGCVYKRCINIEHLEMVTRAENSRRASGPWPRYTLEKSPSAGAAAGIDLDANGPHTG